MSDSLELKPIGAVRRSDEGVTLDIFGPYRPGLVQLDRFSHVLVLWWASLHDDPESRSKLVTELPCAPEWYDGWGEYMPDEGFGLHED